MKRLSVIDCMVGLIAVALIGSIMYWGGVLARELGVKHARESVGKRQIIDVPSFEVKLPSNGGRRLIRNVGDKTVFVSCLDDPYHWSINPGIAAEFEYREGHWLMVWNGSINAISEDWEDEG